MEKKERHKEIKKRFLDFRFSVTLYTSILCKCIQNLKTMAVLGAEKSLTKNLYWRKRKMDK